MCQFLCADLNTRNKKKKRKNELTVNVTQHVLEHNKEIL